MDNSNQDIKAKAFKVIIVGPQAVGKSSILFRLSQSKFNNAYMSTIGIDFKTYNIEIESNVYSLQIWDTAGQEKFRALTSTYYKGSQGCVCVFDLSDITSLEKCEYYLNKAIEENIPRECIYLVGNKKDILKNLTVEEGRSLAERFEINYEECSALDGTNISDIFDRLGHKMIGCYGMEIVEEGEQLKPKVSIREGRKNCCGG